MSNVTLMIGGRALTVACAAGEEGHVRALGATIDAKVAAMGGAVGQSEARMLLFAALMLADELHELQDQLAEAPPPPDPATLPNPVTLPDPALAGRLEALASSLENLAERLEVGTRSA